MEEVQQPNPCNISLVEDIPYELQIRIVTFLNLKTVTAIARTCKALYKHRYGSKVLPASNEDISYLDIYKRISYPELLIADNFDIIHNNDPYWKTITIRDDITFHADVVGQGFVAVKLVPAYKTRNDKENSETEENLDANDSSDLAFFSNMDIGSTIDEQDEHDEHNERNGQDESKYLFNVVYHK
ncbi:hypothetical protein BDF19DRAFT_434727 [Syncephalis fuscata]|nr:hypothetical protein BDF19DRAFT_434727 [Syncephalis fuscata]